MPEARARHRAAAVALLALSIGSRACGDSKDEHAKELTQPSRAVCGRLSEHEGLPVLELWGTREQAAYAHGYLLARQILSLFDGYVLSEKIIPSPQVYEAVFVPGVRRQFVWSTARERELEALAQGMQDRLGADKLRSKVLARELKLEDLMVANALADWKGMACSTFSAWGALTVDGQTLTARNLDFPSTPVMARQQLVVIYRGNEKRRSWIGVTWPGLIGGYTAMNDAGVTMLMHDAPGLPPSEAIGFTPRSLILREALEQATAEDFAEEVQQVLQDRRVIVGNNIHVSGPLTRGRAPAVVFEYDTNSFNQGVTVRTADNSDATITDALWNTNHFRLRRPPQQCWRYDRLTLGLKELAAEGRRLDPTGAMRLIQEVENDLTLHSVCFVPHEKRAYVCIPAVTEKVVAFDLNQWLRRPTRDADEEKRKASQGAQP